MKYNKEKIKGSKLNPKNWGVPDYSDKGNFNTAYSTAREAGEKEFMWNNKRFNTKYDGTLEQQLKETGITDKQMLKSNIIRDKIYNNLQPRSYEAPLKRIFEALTTPSHDVRDMPHREDAWSLYMGKPQTNNTFSISRYKPSKSIENNHIYYSINKIDNKDFEESLLERDIDNPYSLDSDYNDIMGNYTINTGEDEHGKYISYYDKWDLNPLNLKNPINNKEITTDIGKPFEIYNRIYYRDNPDKDRFKEYDGKIQELWGLAIKTQDKKYADEAGKLYDIRNSYYKKQNKYIRQYYSDKELSELDINKKNFDTLALQRELSNRGYKLPKSTKEDGTLDGILGDESKNALLDYQINNYEEGGTLIPKDKKKITFKYKPYTAVQDNTYVEPKNTVHKTKQDEFTKHYNGGKLNNHANINMKFNKEKTKKFATGGKTPKEIMEEARRNQAIERQAQARDKVKTSGIAAYQSTPVTIQAPRQEVALKEYKPISFSEAFRRASKAELKEFDWLDPKTGKMRKIAVKLANESTNTNTSANTNTSENNASTAQSPNSAGGTTSRQLIQIGNHANTGFLGPNGRKVDFTIPQKSPEKSGAASTAQQTASVNSDPLFYIKRNEEQQPASDPMLYIKRKEKEEQQPAQIPKLKPGLGKTTGWYPSTSSFFDVKTTIGSGSYGWDMDDGTFRHNVLENRIINAPHFPQIDRSYSRSADPERKVYLRQRDIIDGDTTYYNYRGKQIKDPSTLGINLDDYFQIRRTGLTAEEKERNRLLAIPQGEGLPEYQQGGQIPSYQSGVPIYRRNLWERFWNIKPKAQPVLDSGDEAIRRYRDGNVDKYEIIKDVPYGVLTSTREIKYPGTTRPDTLYRRPDGEEFKSKDIKKNPSLQSYPDKFNKYFKYQQGGKVEAPTDEMYVDFAVRFLSKLGVGEQDMVDEEGGLKDEHTETVTTALQELEATPDFWDTYVSDPDAAVDAYIESKQSPEQVEMARKGAKLKNLQKLKKGTAKKCKCGCDLTMKKEKGGTITEVCSCGCKAK